MVVIVRVHRAVVKAIVHAHRAAMVVIVHAHLPAAIIRVHPQAVIVRARPAAMAAIVPIRPLAPMAKARVGRRPTAMVRSLRWIRQNGKRASLRRSTPVTRTRTAL